MPRWIPALVVAIILSACSAAPAPPAPAASEPDATRVVDPVMSPAPTKAATPAPPEPSAPAEAADPSPEPDPTAATTGMTAYERELMGFLREDARLGCEPRRSDLPEGATAAVECHVASPLVERVGVYGFMAGDASDADQTFLDRAAFAYLDRMERQRVLGGSGDCVAGTPQDVSWQGPEADEAGSDVSIQVEYGGRTYSVFRYGCFVNEQGVANFRATCGEGAFVGVLGRTSRLDELSAWALRWPDPEEMSFDMPGICAGQQRDTY
jgi:hypothetical protein